MVTKAAPKRRPAKAAAKASSRSGGKATPAVRGLKDREAEILNELSPYEGLAEVYKTLAQLKREQFDGLLDFYYKVGEAFRSTFKKHSRGGTAALAKALEINADSVRKSVGLVEKYTKTQLGELKKNGIEWSHLRLLVSVDDHAKRKALEERVVSHNLGWRELQTEIQKKLGGSRGAGGRGGSGGKTLAKQIGSLREMTSKWTGKHEEAWASQLFPELGTLEEAEPEIRADALESLIVVRDQLKSMIDMATKDHDRVSTTVTKLEKLQEKDTKAAEAAAETEPAPKNGKAEAKADAEDASEQPTGGRRDRAARTMRKRG